MLGKEKSPYDMLVVRARRHWKHLLAHLKLKFLFRSVPTQSVEFGLLFFLHRRSYMLLNITSDI